MSNAAERHYFINRAVEDYRQHAAEFTGGDTSTALFLMHGRLFEDHVGVSAPVGAVKILVSQATNKAFDTTLERVIWLANQMFYSYLADETKITVRNEGTKHDGPKSQMIKLYSKLLAEGKFPTLIITRLSADEIEAECDRDISVSIVGLSSEQLQQEDSQTA